MHPVICLYVIHNNRLDFLVNDENVMVEYSRASDLTCISQNRYWFVWKISLYNTYIITSILYLISRSNQHLYVSAIITLPWPTFYPYYDLYWILEKEVERKFSIISHHIQCKEVWNCLQLGTDSSVKQTGKLAVIRAYYIRYKLFLRSCPAAN